ncbi:MAG TPA: YjzC family protein [Nannocystis sp.]
MSKIGDRFKTGQTCDTSGIYGFDGYTDASAGPQPTQEERVITLRASQTFPPIRSTNHGAYWKLQRAT